MRVPEGQFLGLLSEEQSLELKMRGLDGDFRASGGSEQNGFMMPTLPAFTLRPHYIQSCGIAEFVRRRKNIVPFGTIEDCT